MNIKVKVTTQENERIQEILFKMDYSWGGDSKKVRHVDSSYLYIHGGKYLGHLNCPDHFNSHPYKEVTPSYFEAFDTKLWKTLNQ